MMSVTAAVGSFFSFRADFFPRGNQHPFPPPLALDVKMLANKIK